MSVFWLVLAVLGSGLWLMLGLGRVGLEIAADPAGSRSWWLWAWWIVLGPLGWAWLALRVWWRGEQ